jgi:hypothetical protein
MIHSTIPLQATLFALRCALKLSGISENFFLQAF